MNTRKSVIIIGCGISGASAAEELIKAGYEVTILERKNRVGGKLLSDRNLASQGNTVDIGAVVFTCNYPIIDQIKKLNLPVVRMPKAEPSCIKKILYEKQPSSSWETFTHALNLAGDYIKFAHAVWSYNAASLALQSLSPCDQSLMFSEYAKKYGLNDLARFEKFWVPGMGYGALNQNETYRVLHYMGYGTIPSILLGDKVIGHNLLAVRDGLQSVVEKMIEGMNVVTSAQIQKIIRNEDGIVVNYKTADNEKIITLNADLLVLTMSPYFWKDLKMDMTSLEEKCINQLRCIPYAVAVCDIEDYKGEQIFVPEALESNGLGHVGFISTKGGNRCVVYVNLSPDHRDFSLEEGCAGRDIMLEDLRKLGYPKVNILRTKIWKDYNPTLPWEIGMELEHSQGQNNTIYLGTYSPLSFETVAAAEEYARGTIKRYCNEKPESSLSAAKSDLNRFYNFYFTLLGQSKSSQATITKIPDNVAISDTPTKIPDKLLVTNKPTAYSFCNLFNATTRTVAVGTGVVVAATTLALLSYPLIKASLKK